MTRTVSLFTICMGWDFINMPALAGGLWIHYNVKVYIAKLKIVLFNKIMLYYWYKRSLNIRVEIDWDSSFLDSGLWYLCSYLYYTFWGLTFSFIIEWKKWLFLIYFFPWGKENRKTNYSEKLWSLNWFRELTWPLLLKSTLL